MGVACWVQSDYKVNVMDAPLSSVQVHHPSALISLSLNQDSSSPGREGATVSGSGCMLKGRGHTETLVITTASWLSKIVELRTAKNGRVTWRYLGQVPNPSFVVLMQEASNVMILLLLD